MAKNKKPVTRKGSSPKKSPAPRKAPVARKSAAARKSPAVKKTIKTTKPSQTRKAPVKQQGKGLARLAENPRFGEAFVFLSLAVLALTTIFWTVLSARLHQLNADQLVDSYLFESWQTFNTAVFPGAHTFLLKWPIFALMQLFGHGPGVFMAATVAIVLATVGALVYILYRIDRRPYVFGLLCLALASILLLIPTQPYPGALLPVNMGMTTTRNLEYILFIAAMLLALRLKFLYSWAGLAAILLLATTIASDKLFAVLAVGGILFAGFVHGLQNLRPLNKSFYRSQTGEVFGWAVLLVLGTGLAIGILWVINELNITGISNGEAASPFALINSINQLVIGIVFGGLAVLTNFGANPVHDVIVIRDIPDALWESILKPSILAYLANLLLLIAGGIMALKLVFSKHGTDVWTRLAIVLVGATLAAAAVYVLTDHYYPVDARYLTIGLFALFIASAVYLRGRGVRPAAGLTIAAGLLLLMPLGILTAWQTYQESDAALGNRKTLNNRVSEEVDRRDVEKVIGNYWDVVPVKGAVDNPVTASPVDSCVLPRPILNSGNWMNQPQDTSTAFLAVRDGSPFAGPDHMKAGSEVTYGGCSLQTLVGEYGVPKERVPIHSTAEIGDNPDVLLLMYPEGAKQPGDPADDPVTGPALPPTESGKVRPLVSLSDRAICSRGATLQVVAHQDDDLLFMNPDLEASVRDGSCIRTVYLTAGDSGADSSYWSEREKGAEAAYAAMYGVPDTWSRETLTVAGKPVTVSYLADVPEVSLVFLRLPDGNIQGQGFISRDNVSLLGLLNGSLKSLPTVDKLTTYTHEELLAVLREVITVDQPDSVRTQGSGTPSDGDHSDHHAAGALTEHALDELSLQPAVSYYLGYPTKDMPANVASEDITRKQEIFLAYAKHDGAVCQTLHECQQTVTYGNYLQRVYSR